MFTFIMFIIAAVLIGFFGGSIWLATAVTGMVFAKLFPAMSIFLAIVVACFLLLRGHLDRH